MWSQARREGLEDIPRGEDYAPLDEILELANVSRPLIRAECRHRFRRNAFDLITHPATIKLDKMCHQGRNVLHRESPRRSQLVPSAPRDLTRFELNRRLPESMGVKRATIWLVNTSRYEARLRV